ncbi:MAG TPA: DNA repair protein RecN [Bacteroidota bacterium]|nr:DNA repair protein RecN [Bacteroidota bacterium]
MIKTLYIKNYAIIEEIQAELEPGLNIITGETGAGKSILIDALGMLLGERASAETVRKGAEKGIVEGLFHIADNKKLLALLKENDINTQEDMIVRREVSVKGQSRCFIDDSPVTLNLLKEVGDLLVDLHGQHEHQSLLRTQTHLDLLDDFGGLDGLLEEYRQSYRRLQSLFQQRDELQEQENRLKEKKDLYEFQINEIDAVNPQPGEEDSLESELRILENAEKLHEATARLHQMLYEGEQAVYDQLVLARNQLEDLASIDKSFEEVKNECASAAAIISEVTKFVQSYNARIEFNPERLEQIRLRLGQLSLLKKKYGGSVETIVEHRKTVEREFQLAENFEAELTKLNEKIEAERSVCSSCAQRLSAKRRDLIPRINKAVVAELVRLGIGNASFDVRIETSTIVPSASKNGVGRAFVRLGKEFYEATPRGIDSVEFLLSTNLGEDLKALAKVASGGEVSRVMLALKTVLAKSERLPMLVFDEIDVGVSGRVAQSVGKSMKALSRFHQVVAITHLPQIAGQADVHFVITKSEKGKRTSTRLRKLEVEERVEEIAKLMSGTEVTEAGLAGARELMGLE